MKIGVIDTTGDFSSSFFKGKNIKKIYIENGIGNLKDWNFKYSHSEYVCSMILRENPNVDIILAIVVGEFSLSPAKNMISAIYTLVDEHVDIINISLGQEGGYNEELVKACEFARKHGVIIIASHANDSKKTAFPASFGEIIGVKSRYMYSNQLFGYDELSNDIIINQEKPFISYMFLNQSYLMYGNSFLTAKVTGIFSKHIKHIKHKSIKAIFRNINLRIPVKYKGIKNKINIIISDKDNDKNQLEYSKLYKNCEGVYNILRYYNEAKKNRNMMQPNILVSYMEYDNFLKDKLLIEDLLHNHKVVLRYPYYSTMEMLEFKKAGIILRHYLI